MSHADRPYLTRPLAGVDQALGEGRARQPVELLDQLRERLASLDRNHPSASPRPEQAAAPQESAQASRPDRSSSQKEGTQAPRGDQMSDHGAGEPPADRQPGQLAASAADGTVTGLAGAGQHRTVDVVRADKGERYRPWFAADDPASPWFAE